MIRSEISQVDVQFITLKMTAQMTEALLKWLSTFKSQNSSQSDLKSWNDVSDGVAMAKVLHRIDSTHFNSGEKHFILNRITFTR